MSRRYYVVLKRQNVAEKINVMLVLILINKIKPEMIAGFYLEGGQSVLEVLKIEKFLRAMKNIYDNTLIHIAI